MVAEQLRSTMSLDNDDRDWVPAWDGDPATWEAYKLNVDTYVDGTPKEKRYRCGPRLR